MGYVTAFRGRRDGYEVPAALAEGGMLDAFVTDLFCGTPERLAARLLPAGRAEKLLSRDDPRLRGMARPMRSIALREGLEALRGRSADAIYARFDPLYGHAAAAAARRHRSDLLMYSAYAEAAFTARYRHDPRKLLFQYHPHIALERAILEADLDSPARRTLPRAQAYDSGLEPNPIRLASDETWRLADHILCASSFTKRSLVEAGARAESISVIPYGVDLPPWTPGAAEGPFRALFVGTGLYRKGLHHLLAAWRQARLPGDARLTVVARRIEPALLELARTTPGVEYRAGVSADELHRLYATSTLFVMPSLVEGFGQVFLEALSHGLPVLGTANTCLPDLADANRGVFVVAAGESGGLAASLNALARKLQSNGAIRHAARATAERHGWALFRSRLRDALVA